MKDERKGNQYLSRTSSLLESKKLTDLPIGIRNIVINANEPSERFKARTDQLRKRSASRNSSKSHESIKDKQISWSLFLQLF